MTRDEARKTLATMSMGMSTDMVTGEHYAGGKSLIWHIAAVGDYHSEICGTWEEAIEQIKKAME